MTTSIYIVCGLRITSSFTCSTSQTDFYAPQCTTIVGSVFTFYI